MLDVRHPELRPHALEGNFGLEREALRVTGTGRMALTPHPFLPDHPRIVRDFCENQTEINTGVHTTAEAAVAELAVIDAEIRAAIAQQGERLWTNSNPPPTLAEDEIVPAKFDGTLARKSVYRDYLAAKYGKQLMAWDIGQAAAFCKRHPAHVLLPCRTASAWVGACDVPGWWRAVHRQGAHLRDRKRVSQRSP